MNVITDAADVERIVRLFDAEARDRLVKALDRLAGSGDPEIAHNEADALLLAYIGDPEVTRAFDAIAKWYA